MAKKIAPKKEKEKALTASDKAARGVAKKAAPAPARKARAAPAKGKKT